MILKKGNMWDSSHPVKLFSANSSVTKEGRLVMGRGAALEAKTLFPGCDLAFGSLINHHHKVTDWKPYGVLIHPDRHSPILAAFQVKDWWSLPAKEELIVASVSVLHRLLLEDWKYIMVDMNFPGINNGRLLRKDILPLLLDLPDNVNVWEK